MDLDASPRGGQLDHCETLAGTPPAADGLSVLTIRNGKDFSLAHQDRLNIAVFIDFDNIEIGVKTTLNQQFDVGTILDAIKERGEVVTKIAYADWTRAGEYSRTLTQHAIRLVQRNLTPGGDKNGADINLALDALEMAFTHPHINAYVIVGGDSDFITLVEKLKQYDKQIFVVGGRAFTSGVMQRNCHEFIAYENLAGAGRRSERGRPSAQVAQAPSGRRAEPQHAQGEMRVADGIKEVRRLFQTAPNPPRWPMYVRQVKQFLRGVDPSFDERRFGFATLVDLLRASQREGLFRIERDRQGVMRVFGGNVMQQAAASAEQSQAEPAVAGMTDVDIVESISGPEPEVVDGAVVQEIEPTPPVVDVEAAPPDAEPPGGRKPSRRRRAGAGTPAPRPRKSASRPRRSRAAKEPAPEPGQA